MFRNMIRTAVRELEDGLDPKPARTDENGITRTNANDTVIRLPAAADPEEDKKLLMAESLRLAEEYIANPPLLPS